MARRSPHRSSARITAATQAGRVAVSPIARVAAERQDCRALLRDRTHRNTAPGYRRNHTAGGNSVAANRCDISIYLADIRWNRRWDDAGDPLVEQRSIERLMRSCVPAGTDKNHPAAACRSNKCLRYRADRITVGRGLRSAQPNRTRRTTRTRIHDKNRRSPVPRRTAADRKAGKDASRPASSRRAEPRSPGPAEGHAIPH